VSNTVLRLSVRLLRTNHYAERRRPIQTYVL